MRDSPPGETIAGRYRIVALLGRGMGEIYRPTTSCSVSRLPSSSSPPSSRATQSGSAAFAARSARGWYSRSLRSCLLRVPRCARRSPDAERRVLQRMSSLVRGRAVISEAPSGEARHRAVRLRVWIEIRIVCNQQVGAGEPRRNRTGTATRRDFARTFGRTLRFLPLRNR